MPSDSPGGWCAGVSLHKKRLIIASLFTTVVVTLDVNL